MRHCSWPEHFQWRQVWGSREHTSLPSGPTSDREPQLFSRGLGGKCVDNGVHRGQQVCTLGLFTGVKWAEKLQQHPHLHTGPSRGRADMQGSWLSWPRWLTDNLMLPQGFRGAEYTDKEALFIPSCCTHDLKAAPLAEALISLLLQPATLPAPWPSGSFFFLGTPLI